MRLDKYLKVSRLIKRRTLAKEVAEGGRVTVNGRTAKPSTELHPGDELTIGYGRRRLTVRVREIRETVRAAEAADLYEVLADVRTDAQVAPEAGQPGDEPEAW